VTSVLVIGTEGARAGGYYYQASSFYVTPPIYANLPVFTSPPIVVYEPVVTYPAPVAGYFAPIGTTLVTPAPAVAPVPATVMPAPAAVVPSPVAYPAGRVRERQISTPFRTRYDYKVDYPGGLDYRYRYRRVGGVVRFSERWDD
jgi:hypothetical protein